MIAHMTALSARVFVPAHSVPGAGALGAALVPLARILGGATPAADPTHLIAIALQIPLAAGLGAALAWAMEATSPRNAVAIGASGFAALTGAGVLPLLDGLFKP